MEIKERPSTWQEGDYTVTRSTAWAGPGCHEGCGILMYVRDGKLEKVEGDPEHPFNQGHLCPRCIALPEVVNHPDRLKYPMKRAHAERGNADAWERISWDEALDIIEENVLPRIEKYGANTFTAFSGTARELFYEAPRLTFSLGSVNNNVCLSGISCYIPRAMGSNAVSGAWFPTADCSQYFESRYDSENTEWVLPEYIVIWGCNPVVSNPDYFFGDWIVQCMMRGSRLIVIDPKLTWLASRADVWIGLRPGTDGAVALAMLKTIVDEDLYDHDFVENWTFGFDELVKRLDSYDLDGLAEACWVSKEKLQAAARAYANAAQAAIQLGLAVDQQANGVSAVQGIQILEAITGNYDRPGGQIAVIAPFDIDKTLIATWGHEFIPEENLDTYAGSEDYPLMKAAGSLPSTDKLIEQLETGKPCRLTVGWIQGSNPIACMCQDPKRWIDALKKSLEFVVGVDIFMTPSIQALADVVLPVCTLAEKDGLRAMLYNVSTTNKALDRYEESYSDIEIVTMVGKRLKPEYWPYEAPNDMLDEATAPSGKTFAEFQKATWTYPDFEYYKYKKGLMRKDGQPGFNTPTGKFEIYSNMLAAFGLDPLPGYKEPAISPVSTPELYKEYPLVLITGARSKASFHSEHRQIPLLREIVPDPYVEISPEYAAEHNISTGDWVWIENQKDRIRQKARVTRAMQPNFALSYHAWWFPEKDPSEPSLYGMLDVNNNRLIDMGHQGPSGFGADIKCVLVKIYKVQPGEELD